MTLPAHRDTLWSGTIHGDLEDITDSGEGRGTVAVDAQVVLEERSTPIELNGCEVGRYTQLYAGGTTVRNVREHVNEVDGTRCTADYTITLTDSAPSGWIIEKLVDVDISPVIQFDVPHGNAYYQLTFYTADVPSPGDHVCNNDDAEGPYDMVVPTVGNIPIPVEQWDLQLRTLEPGGMVMTGSYEREWLTGDEVDRQSVDWHIVRNE